MAGSHFAVPGSCTPSWSVILGPPMSKWERFLIIRASGVKRNLTLICWLTFFKPDLSYERAGCFMFLFCQQPPGMSSPKKRKKKRLLEWFPIAKINLLSINITMLVCSHFIYGHPSVVQMKNIQDIARILAQWLFGPLWFMQNLRIGWDLKYMPCRVQPYSIMRTIPTLHVMIEKSPTTRSATFSATKLSSLDPIMSHQSHSILKHEKTRTGRQDWKRGPH